MTVRLAATALLIATTLAHARAQDEPILDLIIERLGVYLAEYETSLSALVADEAYVQREIGRYQVRTQLARIGPVSERRLESEITFLRLPSGAEWYGIRDVQRVNGKPVKGTGVRLADLLKSPGKDFGRRAAAIVEASSSHNLGGRRTINMPTVPLEVLSIQNHPRFIFKQRGYDRVSGVRTARLDFEEFDEPTIVRSTDGGTMWTRGSAWIETTTGRLWRAELYVGPDAPGAFKRLDLESRLRVEFRHDAALDLLVPKELVEDFWIANGRGEGRARYSNFRRFSTSARIVQD